MHPGHPPLRNTALTVGTADDAAGMPKKINDAHNANLEAARTLGLNTTSFEISLPRRFHTRSSRRGCPRRR
eukprot:2375929-Prymnesium_polylepis.2